MSVAVKDKQVECQKGGDQRAERKPTPQANFGEHFFSGC